MLTLFQTFLLKVVSSNLWRFCYFQDYPDRVVLMLPSHAVTLWLNYISEHVISALHTALPLNQILPDDMCTYLKAQSEWSFCCFLEFCQFPTLLKMLNVVFTVICCLTIAVNSQ